jgi:hypothetical protein
MLKAKVSKTPKQNYTIDQAAADLGKLLPYMHKELTNLGIHSQCSYCGADLANSIGSNVYNVYSIATFYPNEAGDELAEVNAVCKSCFPKASQGTQQTQGVKGLVIPSNEQKRIEWIKYARTLAINAYSEKVGFPLVSRPLLCDNPAIQAVLYIEDKSYSTVFPWQDSDPWLIGGRMAKDALAVYKSIEAGKTEVTLLFGKPVLNINDEELLQELAKGGAL